jgi:hypothetical protein
MTLLCKKNIVRKSKEAQSRQMWWSHLRNAMAQKVCFVDDGVSLNE